MVGQKSSKWAKMRKKEVKNLHALKCSQKINNMLLTVKQLWCIILQNKTERM